MTGISRGVHARAATLVAELVSLLVRTLKMGEGATVPGRVLLGLYPQAIQDFSIDMPVVLISGTNAKTTTTALVKAALSGSFHVVSNITGANMTEGIAFALSKREGGSPGSSVGVFEVDEAYLPAVASQVLPHAVVLLNLSRDQLDRVSETRMTSAKWRRFLSGCDGISVVANCDDPLVVFAAQDVDGVRWVEAGLSYRQDARSCPVCGGEIEFEQGGWSCSCGFRRPRPEIEVLENRIVLAGRDIVADLSLPGKCNISNAAVALGVSVLFGVDPAVAMERMSHVSEVAGRYRRVDVGDHQVRMLLSKNPAGWMEVFDLVEDDKSVVIAINSRIADGRDPSWLWDVPFELLKGREVFASGERAADLSVRLHYAGIDHCVVKAPLEAIAACSSSKVSFVGNYTSFQDLRRGLDGDGHFLNRPVSLMRKALARK